MNPQNNNSSLSLELRIIRVRNINMKSSADIFVRCYLSAGSNKRVKLDSHEISSKSSDLSWNQTFSLDCSGTKDTIKHLIKQGTIIFELRRRISAPIIGRMSGSKLLAKAEMPWNDIVGGANSSEIEKWVVMIPRDERVYDDIIKPSAVQISMRIQEFKEVVERRRISEDNECGCMDNGCNSCVDYELFAIGASLEAF